MTDYNIPCEILNPLKGSTLAVIYSKESIFLKSCDLPRSEIIFYPIIREDDYEEVLISTIRSISYNSTLLPTIFDIILHLKVRVTKEKIKKLLNPFSRGTWYLKFK